MSMLLDAVQDAQDRAAIVGPEKVVTVPLVELERLKDALVALIANSRARLTSTRVSALDKLKEIVARNYGITVEEMVGKSKFECICWPRQVCMYLAREMGSFSFREIAQAFGDRDHTVVMYAVRAVQDRMLVHRTKAEIEELKQTIRCNSSVKFDANSEVCHDNTPNPKS